jgi:lipopolysaccharide export LptBFGC system permease protein LptF
MKTLNIYVSKEFIYTAAVTIVILTFGLTGVRLIKIIEVLSKGVPFTDAINLILYAIPFLLTLAIPCSILVATMLTFGKMSANNEITAMRACGTSILQIISPIILITLLSSFACLYLQLNIGPKYMGIAKHMLKEVGAQNPLALIEPGLPIEYENINIFIDNKDENNVLRGIQVYIAKKDKSSIEQDVFARTGEISVDDEKQIMKITLFDAMIKSYEGDGVKKITSSKQMDFSIDYGNRFNSAKIAQKPRNLTAKEILARTLLYRKRKDDSTALEVELNQRIALGFAPVAFLLLGLPLAVKTSRRETSVGLFLSVALAGIYFVSIMIFQAFTGYPKIYPQYLLWIPNIIYQTGGIYFLYKLIKT